MHSISTNSLVPTNWSLRVDSTDNGFFHDGYNQFLLHPPLLARPAFVATAVIYHLTESFSIY